MSLSNKALLVNLSISQWTGRKLDRTATNTVTVTHRTGNEAGQYTKKLLPNATALADITRCVSSMRQWYYSQTLPWYSDGSRILSSKNYLDFVNEYRKRKAEFERTVESFLQDYPSLRDNAKYQLGDLFHEVEYPSIAQLRHCFDCDVVFLPLPDIADFRVEVLDSEKEDFLNRMRNVEAQATQECWRRMYDVVAKAVDKLSVPDAVFRDTLIDNIRETCALLPKLNVNDDPELERMRSSIETTLAGVQASDLRESASERDTAARRLASAMDKMGAFMGGI